MGGTRSETARVEPEEESEGQMTDEQLQSLFAGIERRLGKRLDDMEQRAIASEERIRAEVKETSHALETKLLSEFWKCDQCRFARTSLRN